VTSFIIGDKTVRVLPVYDYFKNIHWCIIHWCIFCKPWRVL